MQAKSTGSDAKIRNKKILLIGGSGFIGLNAAKALSELEADITILCKNPEKIKNIGFCRNFKIIKGDVSDYDSVEKNIMNKDVIINFASVVSSGSSFDAFEDIKTNLAGQLNVLEARKKLNQKSRYIFIGSRAQFGRVKEKDLPIKEDCPQNPISLYGIHKSAAENYCSLYYRAFGLKSIIIRLPQVYGPSLTNEETHSIIDKFIKKALKSEEFYVYGYGKDIKDLIYVDDVVEFITKVLNSGIENDIFNVGSGKKIRLKEIAKKIVDLCGSGSFRLAPFRKGTENFELGSCYFDISNAKKFGWKPNVGIDEGIKKTIKLLK